MKELDNVPLSYTQLSPISAHESSGAEDIFDGSAGYANGVLRDDGGTMSIKAADGIYEANSAGVPHLQTDKLHTVVQASGSVEIEINDSTIGGMLNVHRTSGSTTIITGDKTAVIISGHSGHNKPEGFTKQAYQSPDGTPYSLFLPDNRQYGSDTSWLSTAIRIQQKSGSVQIKRKKLEERTDISPVAPVESLGRNMLRRQIGY